MLTLLAIQVANFCYKLWVYYIQFGCIFVPLRPVCNQYDSFHKILLRYISYIRIKKYMFYTKQYLYNLNTYVLWRRNIGVY